MAYAPQRNGVVSRIPQIRVSCVQPQRKREHVAIALLLGLGLLAWLRVFAQVRLADLQWESRRIERLRHSEDIRGAELLRQRAQLLSEERLAQIVAAYRMQPPIYVRKLYFGELPPPKVYWELPEEPKELEGLQEPQLGWHPASPAGVLCP